NFIWGIDWKDDNVNAKTIGGERKLTSSALYLQDEVKLFPELTSFLGARYDNNSVYGSRISPRVSCIYNLKESTSLRASWGKAFRPPTVNDLYWYEDYGGWGMFGNIDLKPETSSGYEIGIEHIFTPLDNGYLTGFTPQFLGRLTFFSTQVDDLISWAPISPGSWTWKVQNIDKASLKGLEGEIKLIPWEKLSCSLNYTYLQTKDEKEFKGKFLLYRPQDKFFWTLDYKMRHNLHLYLDGEMVGERYTDRENTEKLPSYSLLGAKLIFDLSKKTEIFINIDNLLNEEYEDIKGYPMPGRIIKGGIEITL
ncbi:TonB-dependent receptor, partial [Patescibacteria group bacterium]|nr:TonB-dependent receptor [Patescibacteria group bacterium]